MLRAFGCCIFSFAVFITAWIWMPTFLQNVIRIILSFVSACYLCFLFAVILDWLLPKTKISPLNKAVFITGCDTGFGHLLAKRLDSKGYKVFAGCLLPHGPNAQELRRTTSSRLTVIGLDVTSDGSVQNALKTVEEELENNELWAVVNNAGILVRGECEWILLEDYKRMFEVNTLGVVRVTQAFLPLLRKFRGRVITTTSFAGRRTFTGQVPYSMSKFAANSFCDGLRLEMKKWGVKVVTVEPLAFRTAMTDAKNVVDNIEKTWNKAPESIKEVYGDQYVDKCKKAHVRFYKYSSDKTSEVVNCLEEAVSAYSPQYSYIPGNLLYRVAFWFLNWLPPPLADKIVATFITFDTNLAANFKKQNHNLNGNYKPQNSSKNSK